jgi:putative oxidoreductase
MLRARSPVNSPNPHEQRPLNKFNTWPRVSINQPNGTVSERNFFEPKRSSAISKYPRKEKIMSAASSAYSARPQSASIAMQGPVVFLGRLFFALIFLMSGPRHFMAQTIAYAASQGVPMASIAVPLSGAFAILGALSILLGYRAKAGAWLIVLFLVCVTPMMHNFWAVSDPMMHQMQMIMFLKNLSMLGGALLITQFGSGPWSLDSRGR